MTWRKLMMLLVALALLSGSKCDVQGDDDTGTDDDDTATDDDDTATDDDDTVTDDDDTATDDDDTTDDDDDTTSTQARWTMMVFLNGDNDLESWVVHDINELEQVGSGDGVHVVVQADRIDGYATGDGDWTDARRYYITADSDLTTITSTVVEQLGEVDMGDPTVLSDFIMWTHTNYPADRYALVFWDHGDTWYIDGEGGGGDPTGVHNMVSSDDTSNSYLSIAEGDLRQAFTDIVAARGPLDVVAFDACSMASWEVAHSLQGQALTMAAAETTTGMNGYTYDSITALMRDTGAAPDDKDVAIEFARSAVEDGGEYTHSAFDLTQMGPLAAAMDDLAGAVLSNAALQTPLIDARDAARGMDAWYHDWYLDQGDFALQLTGSGQPVLSAAGQAILDALDDVMLASYGSGQYTWASGSMIFFDLEWPMYLDLYANGAGATWAVDTRWDDLLTELATH